MKQFLFLVGMFTVLAGQAQKMTYNGFPSLVWPVLYSVEYVDASDGMGEYQKPIFSEKIKALANKQVVLPGYMVPFDNGISGTDFMLTSLPLNACFFCGVGGPETVIQVKLKKSARYTEKPVEVRGFLKLNDTDPDNMMYLLEQAEILGEIGF